MRRTERETTQEYIDYNIEAAKDRIDNLKIGSQPVLDYLVATGMPENQARAVCDISNRYSKLISSNIEKWVRESIRVAVNELIEEASGILDEMKHTIKLLNESVPEIEINKIVAMVEKTKKQMDKLDKQSDEIKENIRIKLETIYGIAEKPNFNKLK